MNLLDKEKFDKMIAFLECPAGQRVRTNNHVERANRQLRFEEKVRYKWRSHRSLERFLRLRLGVLGQQPAGATPSRDQVERPPEPAPGRGATPGGD